MNWVLLSFVVITPMSASIGMAFSRRDQALEHISVLKSTLVCIYIAHASWDWIKKGEPDTGRDACTTVSWVEHGDNVLNTTIKMCEEMARLLTLPSASRGRYRVTAPGRKEAENIRKLSNKLHGSIVSRMREISAACEYIKRYGFFIPESTRVKQWERPVSERFERLLAIKRYRTPQALRSFARLFSVFLPPFYAPFYGQMARELDSLGTAVAFSVLTSIALTSLFESITQIEDPFIGIIALDGIDVVEELHDTFKEQLLSLRSHYFPDADEFRLKGTEHTNDSNMAEVRLFQAQ